MILFVCNNNFSENTIDLSNFKIENSIFSKKFDDKYRQFMMIKLFLDILMGNKTSINTHMLFSEEKNEFDKIMESIELIKDQNLRIKIKGKIISYLEKEKNDLEEEIGKEGENLQLEKTVLYKKFDNKYKQLEMIRLFLDTLMGNGISLEKHRLFREEKNEFCRIMESIELIKDPNVRTKMKEKIISYLEKEKNDLEEQIGKETENLQLEKTILFNKFNNNYTQLEMIKLFLSLLGRNECYKKDYYYNEIFKEEEYEFWSIMESIELIKDPNVRTKMKEKIISYLGKEKNDLEEQIGKEGENLQIEKTVLSKKFDDKYRQLEMVRFFLNILMGNATSIYTDRLFREEENEFCRIMESIELIRDPNVRTKMKEKIINYLKKEQNNLEEQIGKEGENLQIEKTVLSKKFDDKYRQLEMVRLFLSFLTRDECYKKDYYYHETFEEEKNEFWPIMESIELIRDPNVRTKMKEKIINYLKKEKNDLEEQIGKEGENLQIEKTVLSKKFDDKYKQLKMIRLFLNIWVGNGINLYIARIFWEEQNELRYIMKSIELIKDSNVRTKMKEKIINYLKKERNDLEEQMGKEGENLQIEKTVLSKKFDDKYKQLQMIRLFLSFLTRDEYYKKDYYYHETFEEEKNELLYIMESIKLIKDSNVRTKMKEKIINYLKKEQNNLEEQINLEKKKGAK